MTIQNILAPMPYKEAGRVALSAALAVAKAFGAHVTAFHVRMDPSAPVPYVAGPMPTELLVQISENAEEHARKLAEAVKEAFVAECEAKGVKILETPENNGVSATWRETVGSLDYRYGLEGRLYDLSVVAQPNPEERENTTDVLEGLLFHSARPVLMVPEDNGITPHGRVVIAWNGSIEATRALRGALPFLDKAEGVAILTVGDNRDLDGPDARALAESLSWRGITADIIETSAGRRSDGQAVLNAVTELGADLLVMGAYSHSRLRELILGGVTQEVIEGSTIPVLMTH
ncbi:MAG: universal stress protein [Alphaproteobacteria bacterium]|nr:MAG: universal stress protein [Alphaproteobacteria bacterium]